MDRPMTKSQIAIRDLQERLHRRFGDTSAPMYYDDAAALRRCCMTLQRWHEAECGDGNDYSSWAIERDEETGLPYMVTYPHSGKSRRWRVSDREAGALKRAAAIAAKYGLVIFQQGDPRGCALYVGREDMNARNYSQTGVGCY